MALSELVEEDGRDKECIKTLEQGLAVDPENAEMKEFHKIMKEQYELDNKGSVDPEEPARFQKLFNWLKEGGAIFDKIKTRFNGPDDRNVYAAKDIKAGDLVLYLPKSRIIST